MLDVCLLGTGGMMPLPYRWLTSLMMRYNGKSILIDCGEGTQIAMKEKGWSPLTLSNPMDCSLPGSSVHGIFLARVLEWVAIAFSEEEYK